MHFSFFFSGQSTNGNGKDKQLNGNSNGDNGLDTAGTASEADLDAEDKDHKMNDDQINHSSTLKIDKNLVPVDLRLHGYLSNLAKVCFYFDLESILVLVLYFESLSGPVTGPRLFRFLGKNS